MPANDESSSDEDISSALREATDHEFLKESLFRETESKAEDTKPASEEPRSLRRNSECKEKFSNFGVTPTFQNFVAKKLDEILEKSVQSNNEKEVVPLQERKEQKTDRNFGIKLLSSSKEFVTIEVEEPTTEKNNSKRKRIKKSEDYKTVLTKCQEVAVDPDWILSKEETKAWVNRRSSPEFKYKKSKNGVLVEQK